MMRWIRRQHSEQVQVGADEAQQLVGVGAHEEADAVRVPPVLGVDALQGLRVAGALQRVDERADEPAVVEQAHPLRQREQVVGVAGGLLVGAQEPATASVLRLRAAVAPAPKARVLSVTHLASTAATRSGTCRAWDDILM